MCDKTASPGGENAGAGLQRGQCHFTSLYLNFLSYGTRRGASLEAQWLRLCASNARGTGSAPTVAAVVVFVTMDGSTPGLPVLHHLPELKLMSTESVMPPNHLILCRPLLLPPSIFPSITIFSSESFLLIRWLKYWNFSFSISPSNEHPGLISFRMNWLDLLAVQGTLKSLL